MKQSFLFILLLSISCHIFSQQADNMQPPYLQVPIIPPFSITETNHQVFKKENLPAKKVTVIIYFNTECDHCETLVEHITDSIHFVPKVFFVLACYNKMESIAAFETTYQLKNFDNIRVGRDEQYFIPSFYKVKFTPFTAVYNKKGNLMKAYENGFSVAALMKLIK
ncbi:MAG: hypothetical protein KF781_00085 [Chitinophagaceae bacterium]|nr:hypothetical protein [Chitinophagaceae bacterium]MCW5905131.1 hypothetical protein [Chitinophagaceae bacterium]